MNYQIVDLDNIENVEIVRYSASKSVHSQAKAIHKSKLISNCKVTSKPYFILKKLYQSKQ